jgi:hypothetical protein
MEKLLNYEGLSAATGLKVRTLRHLVYKGALPYLKLGHKLILFQPARVERALLKLEIKEKIRR